MGNIVEIAARLDIDDLGKFEVLRFSVEEFGNDPIFPDDSHGLTEAGVGILMYRIQQAKRMMFAAPAGDSTTRMGFARPSQLFPKAYFAVTIADPGKPQHFVASLAFQNVLIEAKALTRPVGVPGPFYIGPFVIASIMADHAYINHDGSIVSYGS
jgi:hypothetical protein